MKSNIESAVVFDLGSLYAELSKLSDRRAARRDPRSTRQSDNLHVAGQIVWRRPTQWDRRVGAASDRPLDHGLADRAEECTPSQHLSSDLEGGA